MTLFCIVYRCLCCFNTAFAHEMQETTNGKRGQKKKCSVNSLITPTKTVCPVWSLSLCVNECVAPASCVFIKLLYCLRFNLHFQFKYAKGFGVCLFLCAMIFVKRNNCGNYHLQWCWNTRIHSFFLRCLCLQGILSCLLYTARCAYSLSMWP